MCYLFTASFDEQIKLLGVRMPGLPDQGRKRVANWIAGV
jgi:hypothetical protein